MLNKSCAAGNKTESISEFKEYTYSISINNETETASVITEIKNRKPVMPCLVPGTCCNLKLQRLPYKVKLLSNYSNSSDFTCGYINGLNITLDLYDHFRVCYTKIHFTYGNIPSNIRVTGSHDGITWSPLSHRDKLCDSEYLGAHNAIELSTHSEIPVRYIRYESNLLCKTKIQLSEIEIFGETPSSIEFIGSHLEVFLPVIFPLSWQSVCVA